MSEETSQDNYATHLSSTHHHVASNNSFSTSKEETGILRPDFSLLPDVAWVKVLELLTGKERLSVAQTCRRLKTVASSASVWKSVTLELTCVFSSRALLCSDMGALEPWQQFVLSTFEDSIEEAIIVTSNFAVEEESHATLLSFFVQSSPSLKRVTVKVNDIHRGESRLFKKVKGCNIYDILLAVQNKRPQCQVSVDYKHCADYSSLSRKVRRWCSPGDFRREMLRTLEETITPGGRCNLSIEAASRMISKFPSLQHLSLGFRMFSNQLLDSLADISCKNGGSFQSLTVCVDDFDRVKGVVDASQVSSESWTRLRAASPKLQAFCSCKAGLTLTGINAVIKPEACLAGITIHTNSKLDFHALKRFCLDHCSSLQKLKVTSTSMVLETLWSYECSHEGEDYPVTSLVSRCPLLLDLHYTAVILGEDVMGLVELDRKWKRLSIGRPVMVETDLFCTKDPERWLEDAVSEILGYPWRFMQPSDVSH